MPLVEPQPKHVYTAKVQIVIEHADPVRAFQVATELILQLRAGMYYDGVECSGITILSAEVERVEPEPKGGA